MTGTTQNFSPISSLLILSTSPVFWSCAVELLPCLRGWKLEFSFKYSLSWSRSLFSEWTYKNISHRRSIRLNLQPKSFKCSACSVDYIDTSFSTYYLTKEKWSKLTLLVGSTLCRWPARSPLWNPSPSINLGNIHYVKVIYSEAIKNLWNLFPIDTQ